MKNIESLSVDISNFGEKVIDNLIKAQRDTAEVIQKDVKNLAPSRTGKYADSIKVDETKIEDNHITTSIYTDLQSEDGHYVGRMIEYGTGIYALEPHIGKTKTFIDSQYQYWYVPATSVDRPIGKSIFIKGKEFYIARPQKAKPHFIPALNMNIALYKSNISKAIKEAK